MTRFEFLIDLRERLACEISGIKNAESSLYWDDTKPNWSTKGSVVKIFESARTNAALFGVHVVGRHADCGRRAHKENYYVMSQISGRKIAYNDPAYKWVDVLDQYECETACPCTNKTDTRKHYVLVDVIYDKSSDQEFCIAVSSILADIYRAIENSGSKRPRSGIREYLLRALLSTNDQILPQSVSAYIAQQRIKEAQTN